MHARGTTELTTTELPDELQFCAVRSIGWLDLAIWPVLFAVCETLAWVMPANGHRMYLVVGAFLLLVPLVTLQRQLVWRLSVNGQRFESSGYQDPYAVLIHIPHRVVVPLSEVKSIGHHGDDERGFYLDCGIWKKENVLPGLTREQSRQVALTILRRFPQLGSKRSRVK